ncbi:GNAT family N-acetyltransferase [Pseudarthrobacter sp. NamE5]|uniref:GNAT family N-acetyltransferase n=1 Tax=Pseudarthrobacter sp. NamE5 TaxID=2576839 RepID=UPI00197A90F0
MSALSSDYFVMLIGRIVAALCRGAFFGVGAVLAGNLVEPYRKAAAVSAMFAGLTTANVLNVPFGTFLGQTSAGAPRFGPSAAKPCRRHGPSNSAGTQWPNHRTADTFQNARLGYWINHSLQGTGIMSAAVGAATNITKDVLDLHRL